MANPNNFPNIEGSELVSQSWTKLLERDASVKKQFAASEFPEVTADDVGTPCYREDEQKWYIFTGMGELDTPIWWCPFDEIAAESVAFEPTEEFPASADTVAEALDFLSKKELPNAIIMPAESSEFVGDNVRAEFPLQKVTSNKNTIHVFFSGVKQSPSSYELGEGGESVIFNEPPAYGETILIQENATILEYDLMPLEASFVAENETTFKMPVDIVDVRVVQVNVAGMVLQHNQYSVNGRDIILNEPVTGNVQITTIYKGQLSSPAPNTVNTVALQDEAVTGEKIADGAITESKLADASIGTMKIADNAITENKLPEGVITSNKIAEGSINLEHLATLVEQKLLGVERVASEMLQENSVNMAKLGTDVKARLDEISAGVTSATENMQGVVKLASAEEILANTGGDKVVTSDTFNDAIDKIEKLGGGRSIGDIFYTSRMDKELNGAVECDGAAYNVNDYSGEITIGGLLSGGELPYISLEEYEEVITLNGSCRCFGWDGGDIFRVPTLSEVYIEANLAAGAGRYRAMVQLYTGAKEISITDYTNRIEEVTINAKEDVTNTVETAISDLDNAVASGKSEIEDAIQEGLAGVEGMFEDVADLKKTALRTDQITNCITEIPQNIKLELVDGILTLKAGSKVYVPNGAGVFDEVVITVDKTLGAIGTYTGSNLLFFDTVNESLIVAVTHTSETTAPTSGGGMWYDTTNNFVRIYSNGVVNQSSKVSLPIAIATRTNGVPTSIDQVFNGFGYIGSTVFALPGVKGLIPDGRNDDGSLRNIEFEVDRVLTRTSQPSYSWDAVITVNDTGNGAGFFGINDFIYNKENSFNYFNNVSIRETIACKITQSSGKITSLTPKLPFRAVDYNDSSWVSTQAMPSGKYIALNFGATNTSYIAPANGWFTVSAWTTATATSYIHLVNTSNELAILLVPHQGAGYQQRCFIPAKEGDVVKLVYGNLDTSRSNFKFIYAEGEN